MHHLPRRIPVRVPSGIALGILVTLVWLLLSGIYVQQHHKVPTLADFKGSELNVAACKTTDVRMLNDCLDTNYAHLLANWRTETGTTVVMPPMLAWIFALLHSLASGFGLIRRRQRA